MGFFNKEVIMTAGVGLFVVGGIMSLMGSKAIELNNKKPDVSEQQKQEAKDFFRQGLIIMGVGSTLIVGTVVVENFKNKNKVV